MTDAKRFSEMFEYLRESDGRVQDIEMTPLRGALVFGRADPLVAHKAGELANLGRIEWAVITGNVGKDSGTLKISEAAFLGGILLDRQNRYNIFPGDVYLEEKATNGGENARFGLATIKQGNLPLPNGELITVTHATSTRRLSETVRFEAGKSGSAVKNVIAIPTNYKFDPEKALDQVEASGELLRLADWPAKGLLSPQVELPEHLIELARATVPATPKQPSTLAGAVLRRLPPSMRQAVMRRAGGGSNIPHK